MHTERIIKGEENASADFIRENLNTVKQVPSGMAPGPGWKSKAVQAKKNDSKKKKTFWTSPGGNTLRMPRAAFEFEEIRRECNGDEGRALPLYLQKRKAAGLRHYIVDRGQSGGVEEAPGLNDNDVQSVEGKQGSSKTAASTAKDRMEEEDDPDFVLENLDTLKRVPRGPGPGWKSKVDHASGNKLIRWISPRKGVIFKFPRVAFEFEGLRRQCNGDEAKALDLYLRKRQAAGQQHYILNRAQSKKKRRPAEGVTSVQQPNSDSGSDSEMEDCESEVEEDDTEGEPRKRRGWEETRRDKETPKRKKARNSFAGSNVETAVAPSMAEKKTRVGGAVAGRETSVQSGGKKSSINSVASVATYRSNEEDPDFIRENLDTIRQVPSGVAPGPGWKSFVSVDRKTRWKSPREGIVFRAPRAAFVFEGIRRQCNGDEGRALDLYLQKRQVAGQHSYIMNHGQLGAASKKKAQTPEKVASVQQPSSDSEMEDSQSEYDTEEQRKRRGRGAGRNRESPATSIDPELFDGQDRDEETCEYELKKGQHVWVTSCKARHPAVIESIVQNDAEDEDGPKMATVRWSTMNTLSEVEVDRIRPMHDERNGAYVSSSFSKRIRKQTDHFAPPTRPLKKVKVQETSSERKERKVNRTSMAKASTEKERVKAEDPDFIRKNLNTVRKVPAGVPPGPGWKSKLVPEGTKTTRRWISPREGIVFKFARLAFEFEDIRRQCNGDEERALDLYKQKRQAAGQKPYIVNRGRLGVANKKKMRSPENVASMQHPSSESEMEDDDSEASSDSEIDDDTEDPFDESESLTIAEIENDYNSLWDYYLKPIIRENEEVRYWFTVSLLGFYYVFCRPPHISPCSLLARFSLAGAWKRHDPSQEKGPVQLAPFQEFIIPSEAAPQDSTP